MIRDIGVRPIIFSVNCYIATILTMFVAFSLDLKSPGWAMTTVYLTSQPLSGAMRAKAVYRAIGTFVGAAAMVAIVPNLVDAPELTTLAIMLWVALCVFVSLLDRTPRSYMFVLSGYTAALIGFPSVLAPETVFDTALSRVEEITLGVVCAAIVHSLFFPKSAFSAFEQKLECTIADTRRWLADGLIQQATPEVEMERRRIAADISELYVLGTSLRFDTSPHRPDIGTIRAFDRKIVALLPLVSAIEDRLTLLRRIWPLDAKLSQAVAGIYHWLQVEAPGDPRRAAELKEACVVAAPAVSPQSSWDDLVKVNVTVRLIELVDAWQACLELAAYLADPAQTPSADIRAAATQIGPNRCIRIRLLRCCRRSQRSSRWASVRSFGSRPRGRRVPAPLPLPPCPALYLLLWTIRHRQFATLRSSWRCAFRSYSSTNSLCCRRSPDSSCFAPCSLLC